MSAMGPEADKPHGLLPGLAAPQLKIKLTAPQIPFLPSAGGPYSFTLSELAHACSTTQHPHAPKPVSPSAVAHSCVAPLGIPASLLESPEMTIKPPRSQTTGCSQTVPEHCCQGAG